MNIILKNLFLILFISSFVAKSQDTLLINKDNSPFFIKKDLIIKDSNFLIVEKGSEIIISDSVNIYINGKLEVLGSRKNPVSFKTKNDSISWGRIIFNSKQKNIIKYANIINGAVTAKNSNLSVLNSSFYFLSQREFDGWPVIFIHNSKTNFINNTLINYVIKYVGEGFNFIGGSTNCLNNRINYFPDAIEFTRMKKSVISGNYISNSFDDAIDINASINIKITNNLIENIDDKGISVGGDQAFVDSIKFGKSIDILIKENIIKHANIGISVKDSSIVKIENNNIYNTSIAFKLYQKNKKYGGANAYLKNNLLIDNKTDTAISNSYVEYLFNVSSNYNYNLNFDTINNYVLAIDTINNDNYYRLNYLDTNEISSKTNLPTLFINTFPKVIIDDAKINTEYQLFNDSVLLSSEKLRIEIRGSSSQEFPKKSYELTTNKELSFLGLPKEKDWVLYGPYYDKSLLRNAVAYSLGDLLSVKSPKYKFLNLYINNKNEGLYLIMQKIKRDSNFIDIEKMSKTDTSENAITGGYIFKIDKGTGANKWKSVCSSKYNEFIPYYTHYPKPKNINKAQENYLKNYIFNFEEKLYAKENDLSFIDKKSFIDYVLITELMRNFDGYRASLYFYKYRDNDTLYLGPIWDFNMSSGNSYIDDFNKTEGFVFQVSDNFKRYFPEWWFYLLNNKEFSKEISKRWKNLRANSLTDNNLIELIKNLNLQIKDYSDYEQIDFLQKWLLDRAKWLDNNIDNINIIAKEYIE